MNVSYFGIVILLVVLLVVAVFFALVDKMLKGDGAKKTADKKPEVAKPVASPKDIEPVQETKPNNTNAAMQIYNSELADDLNAMLEQPESTQTSRLQLETHTNREGNISKYIHEKNYQSFNFGAGDEDASDTEDPNQPMSFSREDYKKFMALSNIDDDKPL